MGSLLEISSSTRDLIIYYHGGGLRVGDLDSEDLSCRRMCKGTEATVISVEYRVMPQQDAHKALEDAYDAFVKIVSARPSTQRLILVGSSSGGQLAAQLTQRVRDSEPKKGHKAIDGLVLRCPITANARDCGAQIPRRFRQMHTSFTPSFETSVLKIDAYGGGKKLHNLPLKAKSFKDLPR